MERRDFLKTLGATIAALTIPVKSTFAKNNAKRPNIVLIMSDDMGYSDLGCYGSEINTPNLNALAENGLRFTHFYNTSRCCPTRASLMTGLYPHQAGMGHMTYDAGLDGYRGDLNKSSVTIAEVMKSAGYSTYMSGKWHVTKWVKPEGPKYNWPCQRGYDKFYGTIFGAGSYYDPSSLTRNNTMISPYNDPEYKPEKYYYTDAIADNAIKFIREHKNKDNKIHGDKKGNTGKPFFMYVAFTAAHWPMQAPEEEVKKYKGKYDRGYEYIRKTRYKRMKKLGVIEDHWKLSERAGNWDKVKNKKWEARCMEVYAAMIDRLDQGIGRIVEELKKQGLLENTLLFFLQDNGGCAEGVGRRSNGKYLTRPEKPPFKPMPADELQQSMIPRQTRDGYPFIQGPGVMPGPDGTFIAYGRNWANVSNTPFREYKHWVHEGGISTPLIIHWPDKVKSKGELRHQPGHLIDIMTTCVDVAGANYPKVYRGNQIQPMEGRSLVPAFYNKDIKREAIYWEHEGNRAIRRGKWKLVSKFNRRGKTWGTWELYDTDKDRTETNDLSSEFPELVKVLDRMWETYARRAKVYPSIWLRKKNTKKKKKSTKR